jgi:hypothetical protein
MAILVTGFGALLEESVGVIFVGVTVECGGFVNMVGVNADVASDWGRSSIGECDRLFDVADACN